MSTTQRRAASAGFSQPASAARRMHEPRRVPRLGARASRIPTRRALIRASRVRAFSWSEALNRVQACNAIQASTKAGNGSSPMTTRSRASSGDSTRKPSQWGRGPSTKGGARRHETRIGGVRTPRSTTAGSPVVRRLASVWMTTSGFLTQPVIPWRRRALEPTKTGVGSRESLTAAMRARAIASHTSHRGGSAWVHGIEARKPRLIRTARESVAPGRASAVRVR